MSSQRGSGVSSEGYDGAHTLFEKVNAIAKEAHLIPTAGTEAAHAASKSAMEAFQAARDGIMSPKEAFFGKDAASVTATVPKEFPKMEITGLNNAKTPGADSSLGQVGKAINGLMSNVGDMMSQLVQGPLGMLGSVLSFLGKIFTEVAKNIGEVISDTAQEVASSLADVLKKHLQTASDAGTASLPALKIVS